MKKIKIFSVLLLIISTTVFVSYGLYQKIINDQTLPVITFENETLSISVADDETALLSDVHAKDNRSGDISDKVVVESISSFTEESVRVITYAVSDNAGNVTKKERKLQYTDYQKPQFQMTDDLRFPSKNNFDIFANVQAVSTLDGDLSNVIKYSLEQIIDVAQPGTYPIEFRVMDRGGEIVYLNTELVIYDAVSETVDVNLSAYLVYHQLNAAFSPESYYAGASEEGSLSINSNLDVQTPGVYYVDYTVSNGVSQGTSRLVVVVEE